MIVARRYWGVWILAMAFALSACSSPRPYDPSKFATGGSAGSGNGGDTKGSGGTSTGGAAGSAGASSGGIVGSGGNPGSGGVDAGPGDSGIDGTGTGGMSTGGSGVGGSNSGGMAATGANAGGGRGGFGTGGSGAGTGGAGTGGTTAGGCSQGAVQCSGSQPQVCMGGTWQNMGAVCGTCTACDAVSGTCKPTTGSCDDGNACTQTDTCQGGVCVGSNPKTCTATDQCHMPGVCNTTTGLCSNPVKADGATCSDQNSCTTSDSCQSGSCIGTQMFCNSPPACRQVTTCSAGGCNYTQNVPDGSADSNCQTGKPYCFSGSCVQCTKDQQCSGATPSCDISNHTCVCRRPSVGNLLANPGFDQYSASDQKFPGWTTFVATAIDDAEGCPTSKAVHTDNDQDPEQCVSLSPGTYHIGGLFKGDPNSGSFVRLHYYTLPCGSSGNTEVGSDTLYVPLSSTVWSAQSTAVNVPAGTTTVKFAVYGLDLNVDQLYLNAVNQY